MSDGAAKAFVTVLPDFSSFAGDLGAGVEGPLGALGDKVGSVLSGLGPGGAVVGATVAGVGAIGGALYAIGGSFDEAFDSIRVKTGETGANLQGLEGAFKNVVKDVPTDFGSASEAISTLHQRFGLVGPALEARSAQFLELSRITGTNLTSNMKGAADAFANYGITAQQQGPQLDMLFRVTQQTGIGFDSLSSTMASSGPVLRAAGLDFGQSAALIGTLAKNGVDAGPVVAGLSRALAQAAKDGKPAKEVLADTFAAIKNAPNDTAGASAALAVFGARAGPRLAGLIREGKLGYEELAKSVGAGGDTIMGAAKDTSDLSETWTKFKNTVLVALEPIASRVFAAVADGAAKAVAWLESPGFRTFADNLKGGLEAVGKVIQPVFGYFADHTGQLIGGLTALGIVIGAVVLPPLISMAVAAVVAAAPFIAIGVAIFALGAAAVYAYEHFGIVRTVVNAVADAFRNFIPFITDVVWPALKAIGGVFADLPGNIVGAFSGAVGAVGDFLGAVVDFFARLPGRILGGLSELPGLLAQAITESIALMIAGAITAAVGLWLVFTEAPGKIVHILGDLGPLLWDKGSALVAGLARGAFDGMTTMLGWVIGLPGMIVRAAGDFYPWLLQKGIDLLKGLADGAYRGYQAMWGWITGLPGDILRGLGTIGSTLWNAGIDLIQGFINGIKSAAGRIITAIKESVTDLLPGFVKNALGMHSPSTVFAEIGRNVLEGMALGLTGDKPVTAMKALVDRVRDAGTLAVNPLDVGAAGGGGGTVAGGVAARAGGAVTLAQTVYAAEGQDPVAVGNAALDAAAFRLRTVSR